MKPQAASKTPGPGRNLKCDKAENQKAELQEAAVHELDAAVDRLVSKATCLFRSRRRWSDFAASKGILMPLL